MMAAVQKCHFNSDVAYCNRVNFLQNGGIKHTIARRWGQVRYGMLILRRKMSPCCWYDLLWHGHFSQLFIPITHSHRWGIGCLVCVEKLTYLCLCKAQCKIVLQDCSISRELALEILQSCTKPLIYGVSCPQKLLYLCPWLVNIFLLEVSPNFVRRFVC